MTEIIANEKIHAKQVFVIGSGKEKIGIMPTRDALQMAFDEGLDLVIVSQNGQVPTAKIMSASKYAYEMKRKAKTAKKNSKAAELKEIRVSASIAEHDLEIKEKAAKKFLAEGHDVKVTLRCRGREIQRVSQLSSILTKIADDLHDCASVKLSPCVNGKTASIVLRPVHA